MIDGVEEPVFLRHKLILLLSYFLERPSTVISKEELLDAIWEHGQFREKSLSQSILELRKALGDSASSPKYIRTIPNKGYQWICPVIKETNDRKRMPSKPVSIGLLVIFFILTMAAGLLFFHDRASSVDEPLEKNLKVLVLPFENKTHTASMSWVEYGLSDMMASDLLSAPDLTVTPPVNSQQLLSFSDRQTMREGKLAEVLFTEYDFDVVISGVVELTDSHQVLIYRIAHVDGENLDGSFSRQDLAVSMPDIVSEIYRLIRPTGKRVDIPPYDYVPSAMHEYARGIQSLQGKGPALAQHYFGASVQIDANHFWSNAYLGVCLIYLGDWEDAEGIFNELLDQNDESLSAFIHYWLAVLNFRRGHVEGVISNINRSLGFLDKAPNSLLSKQVADLKATLESFINKQRSISSSFDASISMTLDEAKFSADRNLDEHLKRLTNEGHLALIFSLLIQLSDNDEIRFIDRDVYLSRAVEIAEQLQQPYEQALALTLRARLNIEFKSEKALVYLTQAKSLSSLLKARKLTKEILFYLKVFDINQMLMSYSEESKLRLVGLLDSIDLNELDNEKRLTVQSLRQSIQRLQLPSKG